MELNEKIKLTLENINFSERHKYLANKFDFNEVELFENYDNEIILDIIYELGYNAKYKKREDFFSVKNKEENGYEFEFNMSFKYGVVEFIWAMWKDKKIIKSLGPWDIIQKLLDGNKYKTIKFRNYEDLTIILKEGFELYEDFKTLILE